MKERVRHSPGLMQGLSDLPRSFVGMSLAHIGFGLSIIGVCITSQYSSDIHKRMGRGDAEQLAGYTFQLDSIQEIEGPNYSATEAQFTVLKGSDVVTRLHSQKRFYPVAGSTMTEAGIDGGLFQDLYVSLGEPLDGGDWSVRIYHRPFVRWIWLGAIFMAAGGIIAASDKRYRYRIRETQSPSADPENLSATTRA
jgi:cytochrome c-type biogenesis protein CcmF